MAFDILSFMDAYPTDVIDGVRDFLAVSNKYGIDLYALFEITNIESARRYRTKDSRNTTVVRAPKPESIDDIRELPNLSVIIGFCSCGGRLYGEPVKACEKKRTGRLFYKECVDCTYYAEIFQRGGDVVEIEGGI